MLSIGAAVADADYYGKDNYYSDGDPERVEGEWFGEGAKSLGLVGKVDLKTLDNLFAGRLPNGVTLGKRVKGELVHYPGDDLTFSMPKSAALLATIGGDKRILDAYKRSVHQTLAYIEKNYIETRVKRNKSMTREATGKMVAALFQHDTSRNLDPQPHIHSVILNATQREDGKWRSVYNPPLWYNSKLFTQINSAYFAREMENIRHNVEWQKTAGHLEIEGFPRAVIEHFSTRSQDIQRAFAGFDSNSPKVRDKVALMTRPGKTQVARDQLHAEWNARAQAIGFDPKPFIDRSFAPPESVQQESPKPEIQSAPETPVDRLWTAIREFFVPTETVKAPEDDPFAPRADAKPDEIRDQSAVSYGVRALSEREHAFSVGAIQRKALEASVRGVVIDGIDREIDVMREEGRLIAGRGPHSDLLTTPQAVALEKEVLSLVERGVGAAKRIVSPERFQERISRTRLNLGQRAAAGMIFASPDWVVGVQGFAGTGKTFMLKRGVKAMEEARQTKWVGGDKKYEVFGLAPSNSAISTMMQKAGVEGWTLQRFLYKYEGVARGRLTQHGRNTLRQEWSRRILVVDESSLASTQQMRDLLVIAKEIGIPKVALMGDEKQLNSVEAGKIFELMQARGMPTADMREIRRQRSEKSLNDDQHRLLASVYMSIYGKVDASFKLLDDKIIEAPDQEARSAVKLWATYSPEKRQNTLVITQGNAMRRQINEMMRERLKSERLIRGGAISQSVLVNNHLGREDMRRAGRYSAGDKVRFRLRKGVRSLGIKQGEMLTVVKPDQRNGVVLMSNDKGEIKEWVPSELPKDGAIESYRDGKIELQAGDRIKWTSSDGRRGVMTNETARVLSVSEKTITVETATGKTIDLSRDDPMAASLDYAYAITADEAQGKESEHAIGVVDSKERGLASLRRLYVTLSRGITDVSLIVDDKEKTQRTIELFRGDKTSGLEITDGGADGKDRAIAGPETATPEPQPQMDMEMGRG